MLKELFAHLIDATQVCLIFMAKEWFKIYINQCVHKKPSELMKPRIRVQVL